MHLHPAPLSVMTARPPHHTKHTTLDEARVSACCKSLRPCTPWLGSTTDTTSLVIGVWLLFLCFLCILTRPNWWWWLCYGARHGDVPDLMADPTLVEEELRFHAKQDLMMMCYDLWNWQTKNLNGYGSDWNFFPCRRGCGWTWTWTWTCWTEGQFGLHAC
jgi:hypothetical protein